MLDLSTTNSVHLGDLNFILATGTSGAPAAMPADFPSLRQLHDDDNETDTGWSS